MIAMYNDPELQQQAKYLGTFTKDFAQVADTLKEASYVLRSRGFDYPIFPICKERIAIGKIFIEKDQKDLDWHFYISYLQEFIERQLITDTDAFKNAYKNPDEFCCLFVIDKEFMNFVFVPYPED
ncbi:MAG: hypothetical protein NZ516_06640 [Raineya sp.]|nr:hypothetical protein [Raineya sp.]